jgi:hypothetical protein
MQSELNAFGLSYMDEFESDLLMSVSGDCDEAIVCFKKKT